VSMEIQNGTTPMGDPVVTIRLVGGHDIVRFADRMLEWQCEFGAAGRVILRSLRSRWGAKAFDEYADHLGLGPRTKSASRRVKAGV